MAVEGRRQQIVDAYRTRKLTELQATLFVRPNRPPDDTYNINVTRAESLPLDREVPDTRAEGCKYVHHSHTRTHTHTRTHVDRFANTTHVSATLRHLRPLHLGETC